MKRFVEGEDRNQVTLLPECLDDYIGEDNPVRVIDVFIDALDLSGLGFEGVAPALSRRLADVIAGLKGSRVSVLISQSDLNHSRSLLDAEFTIERGANVAAAAA